ncbi:MAG: LPS export ABC transporter permease LptF [Gammaproteobacteria bacterium]|nr:LPS export ABC transporter permease LptF [Gammaproteobacteria bacterium]
MIVQRYLSREIVQHLVAVLGVVMIIFVSQHFIRYLSDAAAGTLPAALVFKILGFYLLSSLVFLLPLIVFLAVLLALGRLYRDSEMAAMESCGIGLPRVIRSVMLIGLYFALGVIVLSMVIAPWAEEQQYRVRDQAAVDAEFAFIQPGRFQEIRGGQGVFYIESLEPDGKTMRDVFLQVEDETGLNIFAAQSGSLSKDDASGEHFLLLEKGYRYRWLPNNGGFRVYQYQRGGVRLVSPGLLSHGRSVAAKSTFDLWGSTLWPDIAEWQWRWSMPVSVVLLALMAVPLAHARPRQGRFTRLFVALGVAVFYYNALMISKAKLAQGQWPTALGLWWVHGLLVIVIVALYAQYFGWRWSVQQTWPWLYHRLYRAH